MFDRIEKAGLPRLISEASLRGDFEISFDYASLSGWDRAFVKRVVGTLRDFGYTVSNPETVATIKVSWAESQDDTAKEEDGDYL